MRQWKIDIFADGADIEEMKRAYRQGGVRGFTTNPTLMRKAGVTDFVSFSKDVVAAIPDMPLSFEVFSDDFAEMEQQALQIAGWGRHVYVKIPITNSKGESSLPLIDRLSHRGIKLNVTAILTLDQVKGTAKALDRRIPAIVSVFAGRIADTGRDPLPLMKEALSLLEGVPLARLLWASPREILNLVQAENMGCHIITMTSDLLKKIPLIGMSLEDMSLDTVRMFHRDASQTGYVIPSHESVTAEPKKEVIRL